MYKTTLGRQQAEELFASESVYITGDMYETRNNEGVPMYRIGELFGKWALEWFEQRMPNYFRSGVDFNICCGGPGDNKIYFYIYRAGFMLIVSEHNKRICAQAHKANESGVWWDEIWNARSARLVAEDRKSKRAATRKTKLEAAKVAGEAMQNE